jgi:hypothetical protein
VTLTLAQTYDAVAVVNPHVQAISTPNATDLIVVVVSKTSTAGTPSVSGLGATWTTVLAQSTTRDFYIFSTSGTTAGGDISINAGVGSVISVHVFRSSLGDTPSVHYAAVSPWLQATSDPADEVSGATVAAPSGSMAVGFGAHTGGTSTFPASGVVPSSGWSTLFSGAHTEAIKHDVTSAENVKLAIKSSTLSSFGLALLIVNADDDAPSSPTQGSWGVLIA